MLIYKCYPENGVMIPPRKPSNELTFSKIKTLSNGLRFRIIEITQEDQYSVTELSSKLKLSYNKCADYVTLLEKQGLVQKIREGKETMVKSNVKLGKNWIKF